MRFTQLVEIIGKDSTLSLGKFFVPWLPDLKPVVDATVHQVRSCEYPNLETYICV